jgi:RNA polymerase sigma factor (sigma-70 family)
VPATLYQVASGAGDRTFTGPLPAAVPCASVPGVGGTDALLSSRLAAGDDLALAEAFDRFGRAVYGAALRVVGDGASAQDVVQDVFVELWSHPDRYDPAAGPLRTYLIVLARHRAVDLVRSELRRIARQERHHRLTPGQHAEAPGDQVLTGPGGGTWDVVIGDEGRPASVGIVTGAVGFCRLVANRATPGELDLHITGDAGRAAGILAVASALALD